MGQTIEMDGATGQPMVSGANVPVAAILERLAALGSVERVMAAFPLLTPEGFEAAVTHAAAAVQVERRYPLPEGVGVRVAHEPAVAYHARVTPEQAAADADEAFEHARYDYELTGALRAGFGDLKAGRVMPHAEFMAELRALIQA
jgi:uncharacterized protein (DUF433 family)/predicted transcriptional regulator